MNTREQREMGKRLIEIVGELQAMGRKFDTHTTTCGHCTLNHARNHEELKASQAIDAAVGRLEKVVSHLGTALDKEHA